MHTTLKNLRVIKTF